MSRNDTTGRRGDAVVATAVASGATYAAAARQAGVSERTVKRRMHDPSFRAAVHGIQSTIVEAAAGKLAYLSTEAIETLGELMRASEPSHVRLGAARAVLETALRWQELADIQGRLEELETTRTNGGIA